MKRIITILICFILVVLTIFYGIATTNTKDDKKPVITEDLSLITHKTAKANVYANPIAPPEILKEKKVQNILVLSNSTTKTYMDYKKITSVNSRQYQFIYNSGKVHIDNDGYIRTPDGYIGVALGSALGQIGDKYHFYMSTGKVLKLIKIESKDDIHTDKNNFGHISDGHVIEFVVETNFMKDKIYANGYIYGGNFKNNPDFAGTITKIEKIIE